MKNVVIYYVGGRFADMTLDNSVASQNIFSIGKEINNWFSNYGTRLHCYYPTSLTDSTKRLEIDLVSSTRMYEYVTITNNKLKIALNANGIYANGTKVNTLSESSDFAPFIAQKTAQIGSLQGNQRSNATYNKVSIYNRLLSSEELVTLTSTGALAEEI